jgi:predicted MFS family arabinose efflux permease
MDWSIFRDTSFILLLLAGFFGTFSNLIPIYYLAKYAQDMASLPLSKGAVLLAIYNGSSAVGRIGIGVAADLFLGKLNALVICMTVCSLTQFIIWPFATNMGFLVLFAILNGVILIFPSLVTFKIYFVRRVILLVCKWRLHFTHAIGMRSIMGRRETA